MPKKSFTPAPKPTLEAVLDHYGLSFRDKQGGQKISCPVHDDRKPSCSLDLGKGLWKCQSCGAGGDAYSLLMATEGCDFKAAVALVKKYGLTTTQGEGGGITHGKPRSVYAAGSRETGGDRGVYVPSWRKPSG